MAMASPVSAPDKTTGFTDCRHCGCLCLGAAILPCGHVTCRKCLLYLLHNKKPCPDCKRSLPVETDEAVSQLTQLFSSELVLHNLVNQRLQDLGQQMCQMCEGKDATCTMICQDCGEMYCGACSAVHSKMKVSRDHVQQPLPHTLCNAPPGASDTAGYGHRPCSSTSTVSEDSTTNQPCDPTTKTKHDRRWIEHQVQLLKRTTCEVNEVAQAAQNVSTLALDLAEEAKKKAKILDIYADRLWSAQVKTDDDGRVFVSGLSDADVTATVRIRDLQERLCDVRKRSQHYDVIDKLQSEYSLLKQKADKPYDLMTATPRRVFETTAVTDQDTETPVINDVLTTHDGRLFMADHNNEMIKVVPTPLSGEHTLPALKLDYAPWCMSLLHDGLVAVTADDKTIYIVDVCNDVTIMSQFKTSRQYFGVSDGPDDDTLLVTCCKDEKGPAAVDVIRLDGSLLRTVIGSDKLTGLDNVYKTCVINGHVLIPGDTQHCVYSVEVSSGRLVDTLRHPDIKRPIQVVADDDDNVLIVCMESQSVVVRSSGGEWRRLLHGPQHGSGENSVPGAVCLTKSGIVVPWMREDDKKQILFEKVMAHMFEQ